MHVHSGATCEGHPATPQMRKVASGLKARGERKTGSYKAKLGDCWVECADASDRLPFFYNFATEERRRDFPPLDPSGVTPCVLPPRKFEPSAQMLCNAGYNMQWRGGSARGADALERAAKAALWDGSAKRARGDVLAHQPCQLEMLVQQAHAMGINPAQSPELMWLVECAQTPTTPVGWLRCSAVGAIGGEVGQDYYWNMATGITQWEHPHVAFLCGVAKRLIEARTEEAKRTKTLGGVPQL